MRRLLLAAGLLALAAPAQAQDENPLPDPSCKAEQQTVTLFGKAEQKLTFTHHVCPPSFAPAMTFAIKNGDTLFVQWSLDNQPAEMPVAKFWPLNGERPSARIKALAEAETSAEDKGRCVVQMNFAEGTYSWTPEVSYLEDLLKLDEPFAACGTYGDSNDAIQFWKVIDTGLIGYFWMGQDVPFFDPESFEFVNEKNPGKAG